MLAFGTMLCQRACYRPVGLLQPVCGTDARATRGLKKLCQDNGARTTMHESPSFAANPHKPALAVLEAENALTLFAFLSRHCVAVVVLASLSGRRVDLA